MPYIANKPDDYFDNSGGNGHCVAFVRSASSAPHSSMWTRGESVKTANLMRGTQLQHLILRANMEAEKTDHVMLQFSLKNTHMVF